MQHSPKHRLKVPRDLRPFVATALHRLSYLHPCWELRAESHTVIAAVDGVKSEDAVLREIRYALYREKILAETMDMRRDLLRMVSRS